MLKNGLKNMRKHYFDNLRWITILLLIPYHAAMAWNAWNEPNYIFFESNRIISSIIVFLSPYFMPLLFVLAGISTKFALQKRTYKQYILERVKKLLIPFAFGTLAFMPIMTYFADKFNFGYNGSFFQHYGVFFTKFTDLTGADGGFSLGQFWFLLYLFFISVLAIGIIALQRRFVSVKKDMPLWLICILGLPLPLLSELLSIGGKSFAEYIYIFLIGYYIFSNEKAINKIARYKWLFLCIGLFAAIFNTYLFIWSEVQYPLLNTIAKFTAEWFMMIALLGLGKGKLNFSNKATKHLSQTSFAFYILHFIWVVLFQYAAFNIFNNNTVFLYIIPVVLAYIATFLCCELCARIPLISFLMGIKQKKL